LVSSDRYLEPLLGALVLDWRLGVIANRAAILIDIGIYRLSRLAMAAVENLRCGSYGNLGVWRMKMPAQNLERLRRLG
jgi:hypothetical protein